MEIEHKFLVKDLDALKNSLDKNTFVKHIKQGYLSENPTVRIRTSNEVHPYAIRDFGFITVKGPKIDIQNTEFEYNIPYEDAEALLTMCPAVLSKSRYQVLLSNELDTASVWMEIDFFHNLKEPLVLVEIEVPSSTYLEENNIILPDWIGEDVSTDLNYTNVQLIKQLIIE